MMIVSQSRSGGKTMLKKALLFILEREKEDDFICTKLHDNENEMQYCKDNCQNMTIECIMRFLCHYELKGQVQ